MNTPLACFGLRQKGQAMTEFVVSVAFVFLVLFVSVPMFGKIMDMQFQNHQASRYVAWERTVWLDAIRNRDHQDFAISSAEFESVALRTHNEVINSMHNRFFNNQGRGLPTLIVEEDTQSAGGVTSPVWTYVQSKNSMYQGTTVESMEVRKTPGVAYDIVDTVASGLNTITSPISSLLGALGGDDRFLKLDFNQYGYYSPTVKTTLNKANAHGGGTGVWDREDGQWGSGIESAFFHVWDGVLTSRSGILSDGWGVQSESFYQNRTDNLVLSNMFDMPLFDVLKTAASILEGGPANSAIYRLDFGAVSIEPLPAVDGVPVDPTCTGGFCSYGQ